MLDTGWLNFYGYTSSGYGVAWTSVNNAISEDGYQASSSPVPKNNNYTKWLIGTRINWGAVELPDDASVAGIEIKVKRKCIYGSTTTYQAFLLKDSALYGDAKSPLDDWPQTLAYTNFGGEFDRWGESPTVADLEDSTFGFALRALNYGTTNDEYVYVDHVAIKIYYTEEPTFWPDGIESVAAFGAPAVVLMDQFQSVNGIAAPFPRFGTPEVRRLDDIYPTGIATVAALGVPILTVAFVPPSNDLLRINSIRLQISMLEKSDSGSEDVGVEERTNKLLQSQTLNETSDWDRAYVSVTADATTAPDGTSLAEKITETSTAGIEHILSQDLATLTSSVNVTFSVYLKAAERGHAKIRFKQKNGNYIYASCTLDADDPVIEDDGYCIAEVENFGYGWAKYSIMASIGSGGTTPVFEILTANEYGHTTYTGKTGYGIYAWGAQVEEASDTIDYIATTTVAVTDIVSTKIPFNIEFIDCFSVTMAVMSDDAAIPIYILYDIPYPWGFRARVYDINGDRIARTVSWQAKGV